MKIKRILKDMLRGIGYEVRKTQHHGFSPSYLSRICDPATVIDVGVGYGTDALYKAYPRAKFILVEPLKDYEPALKRIAGTVNCDILFKAVSDVEGTLEMDVDTQNLQFSSLGSRTSVSRPGHATEKRKIEVTTLDVIYREARHLASPVLLKLDTEGHELAALHGARTLLAQTDVVIAEVSIAPRFVNGYLFEEIIRFMEENDFYVYSFLDIAHPSGELRPRYANMVFKHRTKEAAR